jgi:preprotein translocase subunit SecE
MTNKNSKKQKFIRSNWILFAFILVLVIFAALTGWISDALYQNNPIDLIMKLKYYDFSLLAIIAPISLIVFILSALNHKRARIFSLGMSVYLTFSFGVTLFISSQNSLFLVYIVIISLCIFYYIKGFIEIYNKTTFVIDKKISKIVSVVLLFSAVSGFAYLLIDAINSLLIERDEIDFLPVNPPQIFDMAFVLPFTIYGAIRLFKSKMDGILISLTTMIFFVFIGISVVIMDITYAATTGTEIDHGKVYSYSFISLINLIITILAYTKLKIEKTV